MIESKKVFIDTAPFIYFIEGDSEFSIMARNMFLEYLNSGAKIITSVFTDIEYKIVPKRNSEFTKIEVYDAIKTEFNINTLSINNKICDIATDIRVNNKSIKLIDAFQLAIAIDQHCDIFVTNDKDLSKFHGIKCVTLNNFK